MVMHTQFVQQTERDVLVAACKHNVVTTFAQDLRRILEEMRVRRVRNIKQCLQLTLRVVRGREHAVYALPGR